MKRQELEKLRKQTQNKKKEENKPPCQIDKTEQKNKERQQKYNVNTCI